MKIEIDINEEYSELSIQIKAPRISKEIEKLILDIYQESEAKLSETQKTAIDQQFVMTSKISEKFESLYKELFESFKK